QGGRGRDLAPDGDARHRGPAARPRGRERHAPGALAADLPRVGGARPSLPGPDDGGRRGHARPLGRDRALARQERPAQAGRQVAEGGDRDRAAHAQRDDRAGRAGLVTAAADARDDLLDDWAALAAHQLGESMSLVTGYAALLRERYAGTLGADGNDALDGMLS